MLTGSWIRCFAALMTSSGIVCCGDGGMGVPQIQDDPGGKSAAVVMQVLQEMSTLFPDSVLNIGGDETGVRQAASMSFRTGHSRISPFPHFSALCQPARPVPVPQRVRDPIVENYPRIRLFAHSPELVDSPPRGTAACSRFRGPCSSCVHMHIGACNPTPCITPILKLPRFSVTGNSAVRCRQHQELRGEDD